MMSSLEVSLLPANISPLTVRRALRAACYGRPLADSTLLRLRALDARTPPDDEARTVALREYLATVTGQCLDDARRHHGVADPRVDRTALSAMAALRLLETDFRVGSADLECWSYLYYRYFVKSGQSLRDIAKLLSTTNRTLERRLIAGHARLAEALYRLDQKAPHALHGLRDPSAGAPTDPTDVRPAATNGSVAQPSTVPETAAGRTPEGDPHHQADTDALRTPPAATNLAAYYRARVADATVGRARLVQRLVPLPLSVEGSDTTTRSGGFTSLGEVMNAHPDNAWLVLGPPGCGKSTLLRGLDYTLSAEALAERSDRVPVFVELSRYRADGPGGSPPHPLTWLAAHWSAQQPHLPPLEALLRAGRAVFLLDALDEIPNANDAVFAERLRVWKHFLVDELTRHPGNRVVISCRTLAYRVAMATDAFPIRRVFVEGLDDEGVRALITRHNPKGGRAVADFVVGGPLLDLARNPFVAAWLAEPEMDVLRIRGGHAEVLTRCLRRALVRELAADNPVLASSPALTRHDRARILNARHWPSPWDLPEEGPLFRRLAAFALHLVQHHATCRTACVPCDYTAALAVLNDPAAALILDAGHALGVLAIDLDRNEVRFAQPLWQAYFAARALAHGASQEATPTAHRAPNPGLALDGSHAEAGTGDGWEDALHLVAEMSMGD